MRHSSHPCLVRCWKNRRGAARSRAHTICLPATMTQTHLETPVKLAVVDSKAPVCRGKLGKDGQGAGCRVDEHSEGLARRTHRHVDEVFGPHVVDRHWHVVDPMPMCALAPNYKKHTRNNVEGPHKNTPSTQAHTPTIHAVSNCKPHNTRLRSAPRVGTRTQVHNRVHQLMLTGVYMISSSTNSFLTSNYPSHERMLTSSRTPHQARESRPGPGAA